MKLLLGMAIALALSSTVRAESPTVVRVKQFTRNYPATSILDIPFNGCVDLSRLLPPDSGEHWLGLDHLTKHPDFDHIEVLVQADRSIIGGRAAFKGTEEEWIGKKGYEARKLVLNCFLGGDGPALSKKLPLAYDGRGFGEMIFTFDTAGNVAWRKVRGAATETEDAYVARYAAHNRGCEECRNLSPQAFVLLPPAPPKETPPEEAKEKD